MYRLLNSNLVRNLFNITFTSLNEAHFFKNNTKHIIIKKLNYIRKKLKHVGN